jgi:hypothetical protein
MQITEGLTRRRVLGFLAAALASIGYALILLTVFDARAWWGHSLIGIALSYLPVLVLSVLIAARRNTRRAGFGFGLAFFLGCVAVTWIPRQRQFLNTADELVQLTFWAVACIVIYIAVPTIYALLAHQRIRDYGLSLHRARDEWKLFLAIAPFIAIAALIATAQPHFQQMYPFFDAIKIDAGSWPSFLVFEILYALTFVALEFFFRGFAVLAGARPLGLSAIPVMVLAYCLLHVDKPLLEMVSSAFGGLILGWVALRYRTIALGVVAHVTLAWSTDLGVLLRR